MLADFETRLADVLGSRLAAPLAGRVFVAPGPADTSATAVLVGVSRAEVVPESFGAGRRPERVPGAADPRRVVRLRCDVRIVVRPADNGTRAQTMAALDALVYELDAGDLRDASALGGPGDPGFVVDGQRVEQVTVEPSGLADGSLPAVELRTEGWFWPRNAPGITGKAIAAALVRTVLLPVALQPWPLLLRAGDAPVPLTIRVGAAGTSRLTGGAPAVSPFGELAVRVVDAGGRPGAGTLAGGAAGPDGSRLIAVDEDAAAVEYRPQAAAADDVLV
ncbi:hypothetical protein J7E25_17510, partial [Agromyces sp. ISL-38]|uniref:hypothetical protein n=1 Tax=Agromyces sp. ISL-38 TaxID=2819107 RepID=UPI001BE5F41A